MAEPEVGAGVYYMTTQKYADACIQALVETAKACGKPLFLVNQAADVGADASRAMREAGLFECTSMASAVTVLQGLRFIDGALKGVHAAVPPVAAHPGLQALLPAPGGAPVTLSEADTKALLARAGLPVPRQALATSADEAAHVAEQIGFPVVMKIDAPGVTHKSDIGGVAVGLQTPAAVREAWARIEAAAERHLGPGRMAGCLVQQSVPADVELIVGARWDEAFGTMVVVGIGGTLVELLHDVRILPAPFGRDEVLQQLAQLKLYPLLTGYRGATPVDLPKLADLVVAIGAFAAGLGPRLMEFDANPVRVSGAAMCIADARAVVR
jgi:acetyl-CoA synthetase (ADP-forming)